VDLLDPPRPAVRSCPPPVFGDAIRRDHYAAAALRAEAETVARALVGVRNHMLNVAAFNLGRFVAAGALLEDDVRAALLAAAEVSGLIADDGVRQAERTIQSGLQAGVAHPREGAA
jgi:hypothetical protein